MTHLNFQSIFSGPENVFWFALGVVSVQVWQVIKAKYKDYQDPGHSPHPFRRINWLYVMIALIWLISIAIGVDNQRTYDYARGLARDVQQCQVEFNTALRERNRINEVDKSLSIRWQEATLKYVNSLANQPMNIARLPAEDVRRLVYENSVNDAYLRVITDLEIQRRANELQRQQTPLPEPSCGIR